MKVTNRWRFGAIVAVGSVGISSLTAQAQDKFPERPIRLLVPFAAGASTDIIARKISARLTPGFGHTVVVENKTGAAGTIAALAIPAPAPVINATFPSSFPMWLSLVIVFGV